MATPKNAVDGVVTPVDKFKTAKEAFRKIEPTKVTGSTIAVFDDTCGELIQLTQLS